MLASFLEDVREGDMIAPRRMAQRLRVPLTRLSKLAHVNRNALTSQAGSSRVQAGLSEVAQIIAKASELSGDEGRAIVWFRHQPIAAFGMTAEQMVEKGHAALVLEHLARMEEGVYS
jgi:hypothetical protein